jgi:L-threonylcarbamoyladenylate synthase
MTERLRVDREHPDRNAIARAAACLRDGGLVAFPTETVYGLGANALNRTAVRRIFEAKGRPSNDPLIVHVAGIGDLPRLATEIPAHAVALAKRFWPGPLTLVLGRAASVPLEVTAGLETVAIRVPAHPVAQALLAAAGIPVAAPSANLFSRPSPTTAAHVLADLDGRIDLVLDAGPTDVGVESTVVDLTGVSPTVLRPGVVSLEALKDVVPDVQLRAMTATQDAPLASPGLLAQHYAPRTRMILYPADTTTAGSGNRWLEGIREALAAGRRVGVLATTEDVAALADLPVIVSELGSARDVERIAARLYAALRELDAAQLDVILAHDFSNDHGMWRAVRDRLRRASTPFRSHD